MFKTASIEEDGAIIALVIPVKLKGKGNQRKIVTYKSPEWTKPPTVAQKAIARAFHWDGFLQRGEVLSLAELADLVGRDRAYVGKNLNLALLAPDIVRDLMKEAPPYRINLTKAMEGLPLDWEEQRRFLLDSS